MKYHFYNSFNLGAGYYHADYIDGKLVKPQRELPHELEIDYKNGGCVMVLRSCDDGIAYLLVKKILYINKNKTHVQQGRTVNINFSIETSVGELHRLCMVCKGILAEWKNFCRRLGDIIVIPAIDHNEYNYSIDPIELNKLFSYLEKIGKRVHLSPKLDAALDLPKKGAAILLVPLGNEKYYVNNAESLRLPGDLRKSPSHWSCVLPASKNENEPGMFEKLSRTPQTVDYDLFLRNIANQSIVTMKEPISKDEPHVTTAKTPVITPENPVTTKTVSTTREFHHGMKGNESEIKDEPIVFQKTLNDKTQSEHAEEKKVSLDNHPVTIPIWNHPTAIKSFYAIVGFILGYFLSWLLNSKNIIHCLHLN